MIRLEGVTKRIGGRTILSDVTGSVAAGQVVVICGRSGSGKTTLIRTVNRLETIDSGRIIVDSVDIHKKNININHIRRKIGFVFQQYSLFPHLSVTENITLAPRKLLGMSHADAVGLAGQLLERMGLSDKAAAMPAQLSGGQKQRAAIARAVAMSPQVLLLDEPTSALDPEMVGEVLEAINALARDGTTMLCVTHEMGFAREVADMIWFMDEGRLVEKAAPDDFFHRPTHPRASEFVASIGRGFE